MLSQFIFLFGCSGSSDTKAISSANIVVPVSNSGLTLELEFVDQLKLENGVKKQWSESYQQPYIDAANKWLNAITAVEGKAHHTIRIRVSVSPLDGGNGMAGPDDDIKIGDYSFATLGTMVIGNHTYATGFDQVEFHANILHEIGHIIGIGSFTEDFMEYYAPQKGNVLKIESSIAAAKYNDIYLL